MFENLNVEIRRMGQPSVYGKIIRDLRTPSVASQEAFEVQLGGMSRRVQVPLSAVYPHPSARYNAGTHVEVRDGGPAWYGQVVSYGNGFYEVRLGGGDMRTCKRVAAAKVALHPTVLAMPVARLRAIWRPENEVIVPSKAHEALELASAELAEQRKMFPRTWRIIGNVIRHPRACRREPGVFGRRLDAFARLLQAELEAVDADPICVAVAYVGEKFLISANKLTGTNKAHRTSLEKAITGLFHAPLAQVATSTGLSAALEVGVPLAFANLLQPSDTNVIQQAMAGRLAVDRLKVRAWLKETFNIKDAKELQKRVELLRVDGLIQQASHAEMRLLIALLSEPSSPILTGKGYAAPVSESRWNEKLEQLLADVARRYGLRDLGDEAGFSGELYLGISFLCCEHCAYVIHTYNTWANTKRCLKLGVRGYHAVDQGGWAFPWSGARGGTPLADFLAFPALRKFGNALKEDLAKKPYVAESYVEDTSEPKEKVPTTTRGRPKLKQVTGIRPSRSPSPPKFRF
jgi:hypothetical protein